MSNITIAADGSLFDLNSGNPVTPAARPWGGTQVTPNPPPPPPPGAKEPGPFYETKAQTQDLLNPCPPAHNKLFGEPYVVFGLDSISEDFRRARRAFDGPGQNAAHDRLVQAIQDGMKAHAPDAQLTKEEAEGVADDALLNDARTTVAFTVIKANVKKLKSGRWHVGFYNVSFLPANATCATLMHELGHVYAVWVARRLLYDEAGAGFDNELRAKMRKYELEVKVARAATTFDDRTFGREGDSINQYEEGKEAAKDSGLEMP